jgi:hypothetical protein
MCDRSGRLTAPCCTAAPLADRAAIFSVIYLLSYSGATIPALIAGQLFDTSL